MNSVKLNFSQKYDQNHAFEYFVKHQDSLSRKLSHWRDERLARKAIIAAGNPKSILDLPSGAGRFWPLLTEKSDRVIYAADNSNDMLDIAKLLQDANVVNQIEIFQTSAFDIQLENNAVECIFLYALVAPYRRASASFADIKRISSGNQ